MRKIREKIDAWKAAEGGCEAPSEAKPGRERRRSRNALNKSIHNLN
jgi:hypothetical protein